MRKILEELWLGNIAPQERQINHGTPYDDALKMMCKNEEKLKLMLKGKEKEVFEKFCDFRDEVEHYTEEESFITGFRIGARIVIELFYENDGFFSEINA
jgi:hypothetical protein